MPYLSIFRNGYVLIALWCATLTASAQQAKVGGAVKNASGKPVANISVLLKHTGGAVIAYDYTDKEGHYTLVFPDTANRQQLFIEINWLGYRKLQKRLVPGEDAYPLSLEEAAVELKEVTVKTRPSIRQMADTLRYDVNSFSRKEDRSIGDVIGRLPGMSVDENGKISFNGKEISNLYIHGDDLMDGRYGLATKAISRDMIKSIDVMLNHQPIRVLQNKVFSDAVAVNLVLKDENSLKLSGQAMLGGGAPGRYEGELNTMLFNKKVKMLNSLKANNAGTDYRPDLQQLSSQDIYSTIDAVKPSPLLSEGIAGDPDLPRKNFYINRSLALQLNDLYNTNDTLQLRGNVQLFFDRNTFNYNSRSDYFLPNDTLHYAISQQALRKPFAVNAGLSAMVNRTRFYLNEALRCSISGHDNGSTISLNGKSFGQTLHTRVYDLSNDIQYTPAIRNNVANIRWFVNVYNQPQRLRIESGIDSAILNQSVPYASVVQRAGQPSVVSQLSAYYALTNRKILKQTYHASLLNEWQELNTVLSLTQFNGTMNDYAGDPGNALRWRRNRLYADGVYSVERPNWRVDLTVPVSVQDIRYWQEAYALNERRRYVLVNPSVDLKWYVNAEDYFNAGWQYRNSYGNAAGLYRGLLLVNYLSLSANDAGLQERDASTFSLQYYLKRNISMLFINAGVNYSRSTANSIVSSVFTNDVQRTVLLPYENSQSAVTANVGISKYVFPVRTTASLKALWRRTGYNQFVNGQAFPFCNETFMLSLALQSKPFGGITLNYNGSATWNRSLPSGEKSAKTVNRFYRLDQQLMLGHSPAEGWFVNVAGRHSYGVRTGTDNINYLFVDANLRYRVARWRTDVEFGLTNLFDIREYKTASFVANQYVFSSYDIRGRMAMARVTFNL